jgi:hypothetical protein
MTHRYLLPLVLFSCLTLLPGCAMPGEEDEDEAGEVKLALTEAPAAVQATIKKEAASGEVKEIEKETENGRVVYEAEVVTNGKTEEITVAEDGTFLGREAEAADEDDDDGEDDD